MSLENHRKTINKEEENNYRSSAARILKAKMKAVAENLVKLKTYCLARKRVHTLAMGQGIVTETS